jgi:hypothetical protein
MPTSVLLATEAYKSPSLYQQVEVYGPVMFVFVTRSVLIFHEIGKVNTVQTQHYFSLYNSDLSKSCNLFNDVS